MSRSQTIGNLIVLPGVGGTEARLLGNGVMEGECEACDGVFWVASNTSTLSCPFCRSTQVKKVWKIARIAFIEQGPPPHDTST